jgi:hypothetical protein
MKTLMAGGAIVAFLLSVVSAMAGEFDGSRTGKWNGKAPAEIHIAGNRVTAYKFRGKSAFVGRSSVSGKTISFKGSTMRFKRPFPFDVTMTLTGKSSTKAHYSDGNSQANASMTRS